MEHKQYGADERPALELTEKALKLKLKLGPSACLYILTPKGKEWLAQELKKQEGAK